MAFNVKEYSQNRRKQNKTSTSFNIDLYSKYQKADKVGEDITNRINKWVNNNNNFINNFKNRYKDGNKTYRTDSDDWLNTISSQKSNFDKEAENIRKMLDAYKGVFDSKWVDSIYKALDEGTKIQGDIIKTSTDDKNFWSNFKDEKEFNLWYEKENFINTYIEDPQKAWEERGNTFVPWIDEAVQRRENHLAKNSADFGDKSKYNGTITYEYGLFGDKYPRVKEENQVYEYINNSVEAARAMSFDDRSAYRLDDFTERGYSEINEEEKALYNYFFNTQGAEKAQKYLDSITEDLIKRKANKEFASLQGNTLAEIFYGAVAGIDQFASGIKNIKNFFTGEEGYKSITQHVAGMVREDLADDGFQIFGSSIAQLGYDTLSNTANMLPSILVGSVTGGVGGAVVGTVGGLATMGASVLGNSYAEMRELGYDEWQSRGYAVMVTAAEVGLQYAMGGISKLAGGKSLSKIAINAINNVDNGIARVALKLGANMVSEGLEEATQEVLDPIFKAIATNGEEWEGIDWGNVAYSGLLGALSAGALESFGTIKTDRAATKLGKAIKNAGNEFKLANYVNSNTTIFSADSVAAQIAPKITANTNAYQIGRLYQEAGATLSEQNLTDIRLGLEARHVPAKYAKKLAIEYKAFLDGEMELTDNAIAVLTKCDPLTSTIREKLIESNLTSYQMIMQSDLVGRESDVYKRTREYTDLLNLANEVSGVTESAPFNVMQAPYSSEFIASKADAAQNAFKNESYRMPQEYSAEVKTNEKTAKESEFQWNPNGKTIYENKDVSIKGISSIKDGVVTVQLEDGRKVNAKDVSFSTEDEALMYDMVAKIGVNPETATFMMDTFNKGKGTVSAETYYADAPLAYQYGRMEYTKGLDKLNLTHDQKVDLFGRGRTDEMAKIQSNQPKLEVDGKPLTFKGKKVVQNGVVYEGVNPNSKKSDVQKAGIRWAELLSKVSSLEMHAYESYKDSDGNIVVDIDGETVPAPNGIFRDGNKIYIDINAGDTQQGTMLYTTGHEVGHYIKKWNAAEFKNLGDFLFENYKGDDVEELIAKKIDQRIKRSKREGTKIPDQTTLYDEAYEEIVCDSFSELLADENAATKLETLATLKKTNKTLWETIGEALKNIINKIKKVIGAYKDVAPDSNALANGLDKESFNKLQDLYLKAFVKADENYQAAKAEAETDAGDAFVKEDKDSISNEGQVLYSDRGVNKYGIEVYETSEETKKLSFKERQNVFLDIMINQYGGRTAKFIRNGHTYYARFEEADVRKNIYGDKRSDYKGIKAKVNVGADGNIFELVEDARYDGSRPELGKKIASHRNVGYWDYFIKTVQIDNMVFDLLANVRKKTDGGYVYSIELKLNKKVEASPSLNPLLRTSNRMLNASTDSTIPQKSDSVKSFSENFQKNSDRDPDIAIQREKVDKILEEENAKLKEDNQYLKELVKLQRKVTHGTKFTRSSVEMAAGRLMRYANAKGNKVELANMLHEFYEYIAKGYDLTWDSVAEKAQPVIKWLQDNVSKTEKLDAYSRDVLNTIKSKKIYLDDYQQAEAAYVYGSFNEYRKKAMGNVTIVNKNSTKDAISLYEQWQEFAALYPELFDADVTPNEQPMKLLEIVRDIRDFKYQSNDYDFANDMIEQDLLSKVYDSYWDVSTLHTVADSMQKEITRLKIKHRKKMDAIRDYHTERHNKLKKDHQDNIARLKQKYRDRNENEIKEVKQYYQESRAKIFERRHESEFREKIKNLKGRIQKDLLNPSDRRYVPVGLVDTMIDVCNAIDTDTDLYKANGELNKAQAHRNIVKEKLQALKEEYEKLEKNADPMYAGEYDSLVKDALAELRDKFADKSIKEMDLSELEGMYDLLKSIEGSLKDARKLIGENEAGDVYKAGDSIIAEQWKIQKSRKGGQRSQFEILKDNRLNLSLAPMRNVERMTGYNSNSELLKLFKAFETGVRAKNMFSMESYKSFESLTSGENAKVYEDAIYNPYKGIELTDSNGKKFNVSKMQMMQAILSYEREIANNKTRHFEGSGLAFADLGQLKKGNLSASISSEYSHKIVNAIEATEKFINALKNDKWAQSYMNAARQFFDGKAKKAVNDTSLALKHRIIAKDKNYIPFEVDKNFVVREISAQNDIQQTINSYGMLQDVKRGASNPLIITGLNNIIDRHIDQVATIYGLAIPIRNFNKVWNVKHMNEETGAIETVQSAIEKVWGKEGKNHITQTVQDLQGNRISTQSTLYKKIKSGYIGATFLLNGSVVMKQIGSMFSAMSMLSNGNPVSMFSNLIHTIKDSKKIAQEVDKYTASVWMRRQGLSDAELHTLMTGKQQFAITKLIKNAPTIINPAKWMTAMDSTVALSLWNYAKKDVQQKTNLQGEALLKETAKHFDEIIEYTQSTTDVLHRPEIQKRDDILSETFGMFKTDLYQMAGNLETAMGRLKASNTKENRKHLAKTVYATFASMMWGQFATTLFALLRYKVKQYRDDETDEITMESWLKRQAFSIVGDLFGYILPIGGAEFADIIENIVYGESDELIDSVAISAINDLYQSISKLGASLASGETLSESDTRKLISQALQIFGVPANNIIRMFDAIRLHAKDIANGEFLSFNAGVDVSSGKYANRIINAIVNGDITKAKDILDDAVEDLAFRKSNANGEDVNDEYRSDCMSTIKTAIGKKYKGGDINRETAQRLLSEVFGINGDELYWMLDKWDYTKENGTSDGYTKYDDFYEAVSTGKNIKEVIKMYTEKGVSKQTLAGQITNYYKPLYIEMSKAERAKLKGYLLNAYTLLGYKRSEKAKDIDSWVKS